MIKKLRIKFIAAAMLAMFIVLTVIIGAINIINYTNIIKDADNLLQILAENNGHFPKQKPLEEEAPENSPAVKPADSQTFDGRFPGNPFLDGRHAMSPETPYETRFFTVTMGTDGTILAMDTNNIAAVSDTDAASYANRVLLSGATGGFSGNYRFIRIDADSTMIIFLDCTRSLTSFRAFLFTSILMAIVGLISVFVLVILFSRIVFRPVAETYKKQKQFITDASHEIKTPLTIIDANTEVLEMLHGEDEWTASIRNQIRRLTALTGELVTLSRLDEGPQAIIKTDFSLSDAAIETADAFMAPALTQGKDLQLHIEPNITCCGDEKSLRQLISILLDNALKYSNEHGLISMSLKKSGRSGCQLCVYNTTDTLDIENPNLLFERFYRPDSSRSSATGGYGIGLSIALSIVHAHKGKISAKSDDGHSLTVTVLLPAIFRFRESD